MHDVDLVDERHRWLLERLATDRRITTNAAAAELNVSVDTIRRDLRNLHDRGLARRVHGGAVPYSPLAPSFSGRTGDASSSRSMLAAAVVNRFRSGDVIGLDAGSTSVEVANQLPRSLDVTIVTNNPAAAVALADHPSVRVVLLGGTVDLTWMATTGAQTVDAWRGYRLDHAVLGACALDGDGASTRSQAEVETKRALVSRAAETILPVQSEKLGTSAPFAVVPLTDIDILIVDAPLEDSLARQFESAHLEILVA